MISMSIQLLKVFMVKEPKNVDKINVGLIFKVAAITGSMKKREVRKASTPAEICQNCLQKDF